MTSSNDDEKLLELLIEGARLLGVPVDRATARRILDFLLMVDDGNRRVNLTAVRDMKRMISLHALDSLALFHLLPRNSGKTMIDVGSGAGFPGMIAAIVDSSIQVTFLEKNIKKIMFLKQSARRLGIRSAAFRHQRLEELIEDPRVPRFDIVVTRAFSSDPNILSNFKVLIDQDGRFLRMVGPRTEGRTRTIPGFDLLDAWEGVLPFADHRRGILVYRPVS